MAREYQCEKALLSLVNFKAHLYIFLQNPRIACLLQAPGFPETEEDAANILTIVRHHYALHENRRDAASFAITLSRLEQQIWHRSPPGGEELTPADDLEILQQQYSWASKELTKACMDIGRIRSVIRRKGLPMSLSLEYVEYRPSTRLGFVDNDSESFEHVSNRGDFEEHMETFLDLQ